jgi:hypothetical protein
MQRFVDIDMNEAKVWCNWLIAVVDLSCPVVLVLRWY